MMVSEILEQLGAGLSATRRRLDASQLTAIAKLYPGWLAGIDNVVVQAEGQLLLPRFLIAQIALTLGQIEQDREAHREFGQRYSRATSSEEKRHLVLKQAEMLGADGHALREDAKAFRRWFGMDAILDRQRHRISLQERRLVVLLERLGWASSQVFAAASDGIEDLWQRLDLEKGVRDSLFYPGNPLIQQAAFACLADTLRRLPSQLRISVLGSGMVRFIYRTALDVRQEIWLQSDALALLKACAPGHFLQAAQRRLKEQVGGGDDFFVRRRLILELAELSEQGAERNALLACAAHDPSPYVRQALAGVLAKEHSQLALSLFPDLLLADPVPQVRAAVALGLRLVDGQERALLLKALACEQDSFVLRVLFQCCVAHFSRYRDAVPGLADQLLALLAQRHAEASDLKVRRWAAQAAEKIWLLGDAQAQACIEALQATVSACPPGRAKRLPPQFNELPAALITRMLAVIAQTDYGIDLERHGQGWRIWRGHRFGFRLWRWLHEMRHASPDKRQAFRHTIGRLFRGSHHAPSGILAELAETKVPGEPLQIGSEAGWRPYLPLVDELISALDEDFDHGPLRIVTAEGVTEIHAPATLAGRLVARARLTWDFARYARLRNWHEGGQSEASEYLAEVARLGFSFRCLPHAWHGSAGLTVDPAVARFFPLVLGINFDAPELWLRFRNYFFSVYENSLFELAVFCSSALAFFIARHLWLNRLIQRARSRIPLVIGGWGTRGKSGTERIKAALFNALGYSVVSKTTGCEAMFLHGRAYEELREMFLFRPYDKATIWEQHNVVCLAEKLGAEVFLWECMALTPAFVQLLQRRWMRDDIATITNTFPDHEDLQGPAGINIPEVMTNFIPEKGQLLTSEEQMRPILRTAADTLGTRLRGVGWLESGLLPPDVLARFPYQEHPDNIALVVALADELGVPEDFALKAMADKVVPDLGVLKVYAAAAIRGRRVSFVNGMSANERFGCLGNWRRLGFDQLTPEAQPDLIVSTVVNNRADRVARSRVFAGILVDDVSADYHFLIGSNLAGLQGYIRESWQESMREVTLWPESQGHSAAAILAEFAGRLRVPTDDAAVARRLRAMLGGLGIELPANVVAAWRQHDLLLAAMRDAPCPQSEEILGVLAGEALRVDEYQALLRRVEAGETGNGLDGDFREQLWRWFERKLVVVEDYYASGNQIIALIAERTPPGLENKVMGIQNIKGTGLDFVYRWQAWDICHRACEQLRADSLPGFEQGLSALVAFREYGLLCDEHVRTRVAEAKLRNDLHERHRADLEQVLNQLEAAMGEIQTSMQLTRSAGFVERIIGSIEGFFDAGDAVWRRRRADRIYADMVTQRISHARATMELQVLNKRQKGGWLYADLQKYLQRLVRLVSRQPR